MAGKGDNYRPTDQTKFGQNYDAIDWGHPQEPKIVDAHNNPTVLSSRQKNSLYKQARELKSQIKEALCTKSETMRTDDRSVQKMINSEFKVKGKIALFKKQMKAIGADPRDYNIEKIRKGR